MIYKLKNSNYRNFDVYKDNVLPPRAYFIPFKSAKELAATDIRTERYQSSMVQVLSGEWDFAYFAKVSDVPNELDTDVFAFDKVTVPSCWQFTGYEPPYYLNTRYQFAPNPPHIPEDCPVGVYRREFDAESGAQYCLTFLGVAGALDVFVNGAYVGYSEGSHNTSEFDITDLLRDGANELVAVVHKFSNGTYLEAQDMFRNNGIFRDVLLTKTGAEAIEDFAAETKYNGNGTYDLNLNVRIRAEQPCTVSAILLDNGEQLGTQTAQTDGEAAMAFPALAAQEWSAECPYLYTLLITLSREGKVIELVRRHIGFRHIEIQGNVFYFNNQPIKLLGVNHHDTSPTGGYVMSAEELERDVRLFKEYNVNCVRTSHYPPDPIFLDLCDVYGVYVVDEADIETHGCTMELHKPGACSHNPAWKERYLDRVMRMYERDKNHPAITMWSLGNESWGYANQDACYEELKKRSSLPVHYEGAVYTKRFAYDVISQMYPWHGKYAKLAAGKGLKKKWYRKPYFLCEYAHAMGVGAGSLETYVSRYLNADNLMGGCIWEFADHAVYHEDGKYRYTYGGDHGEEKHDGNFCVDGLFFPDRTPHAGALQMKNCYRPVRIVDRHADRFTFKNLNYFRPVFLTVKWEGFNGCAKCDEGELALNLAPRAKEEFALNASADVKDFVFRYYDGETEVAAEQALAGNAVMPALPEPCEQAPTVHKSEKKLFVDFTGGRLIFNLKTGETESYTKNGAEYINTAAEGGFIGFGAGAFRAPLDNDMYLKRVWNRLAPETEQLLLDEAEYVLEDKVCKINCDYRLVTRTGRLLLLRIVYSVFGDGCIRIDMRCDSSKLIGFAPRLGLTLEMPRSYDNVRYFGLGDRVNLPDFAEHAMLGEYACKVDDMREKYIKPQESGMRCGVRFAEVTDAEGRGLRFVGIDSPFIFAADHFTSYQCAKAAHQEDLPLRDTTCLHLDAYQLGAGSAACGPPPEKAYRRHKLTGTALSVMVMPL